MTILDPSDRPMAIVEGDGSSLETIWSGNFIFLCLSNFALLLSVQFLLPTLPLYLQTIGGSQSDVGLVMSAYTIAAMFMRAIAGWLSDRWGRRSVMMVGLAAIVIATLLYPFGSSVPIVAGIRGLHGLAFGLAGTAMGAIAADSLPAARMAEGIGYYGLTIPLSMGLAPMIGIFLQTKLGYSGLFVVVTLTAVLTILCGLPVKSPRAIGPVPSPAGTTGFVSSLIEKSVLLPSTVMFLLSLVNGAVVYFIALYAHSLNAGNVGFFLRPIPSLWSYPAP
jgi:MFS family permease